MENKVYRDFYIIWFAILHLRGHLQPIKFLYNIKFPFTFAIT